VSSRRTHPVLCVTAPIRCGNTMLHAVTWASGAMSHGSLLTDKTHLYACPRPAAQEPSTSGVTRFRTLTMLALSAPNL
jgi:hypothetical protein